MIELTIELTMEEKDLLDRIMSDDRSAAPFTGMIFNAYIEVMGFDKIIADRKELIADLLKTALSIRLQARDMAK